MKKDNSKLDIGKRLWMRLKMHVLDSNLYEKHTRRNITVISE